MKLETTRCAICRSQRHQIIASGFDYEYRVTPIKFFIVSCLNCSHCFLNPRPMLESAGKLYPKNYYTLAGRHTQSTSKLIARAKQLIVTRRLSFFKGQLTRGSNLLEVGCGDAELLIGLQKSYPRSHLTGVDLNFSPSTKNRCQNQKIKLVKGSVETIKLPKNAYDLIILNQVIEHLWQPQLVLKKLRRALKPNGLISIETPNHDGYDRIFFGSFWGGYYYPRHFNVFTRVSLSRLLSQTGFKIVKQQNLVAPIVWVFSCHARFKSSFFSDTNPLCLAIFSLIDLMAIKLGLTTSNQKVIASRAPRNI